jgi:elongation of very long chain fatty acids protein 7
MRNLLETLWDMRDPRVDDWPLMNSVLPTVAICAAYFYIVKFLGPWIMKNRQPYDLKNTIRVYNLAQVLFSSWMLSKGLYYAWKTNFSLMCEPVDRSNDPDSLEIAAVGWWYFISKFTEFFDTFFFIARKKYDHVSFLHVTHHGLMPLFAWEAERFVPGGHESFGALFNVFVHVIMYTYYFFAAFGPRFQKYLWWKRHLTMLQMIQFVAVLGHSCLLLINNDCGYPIAQSAISSANMIMFFIMFGQFYSKNYTKKKTVTAKID